MPSGSAPARPDRRSSVASLRAQVQAGKADLQQRFIRSAHPGGVLRPLSALIDKAVRALWRDTGLGRRATLVAVGGYGRGALFPHSDIDLLVLLPDEPSPGLSGAVEDLVSRLWDIGLEPGHSVRTVAQCIEESTGDITVQTSLLEARRLAGDAALFSRLEAALEGTREAGAFFKAKRLEQEQRHAKYQDSPFSLEPNLKEAPGGLRDLQVILWIARAAGIGRRWEDLAAGGYITRAEARALERHQVVLQDLRTRLHYLAGRREDRLLFDYQTTIATQCGLGPTAHKRASEVLMQQYFRTAKAITQLNTILLQNLDAGLVPGGDARREQINERFEAVRDLLHARDPELFQEQPQAILESFLILQRHPGLKGMTAPTLRALWRSRTRIDARFRADPANRARFVEILQQSRGIVHELRRMNQYSILGRYLPAFRKIVGQMQHDLFHVYTVDQHILMVVRNLRRFTLMEFAHEYPLCSRLIAGFERPWVLYVAAIFHDIAKGRGGDHSKLGRVDAGRFCRSHGMSKADTDLVGFLVEHHLDMSSVAQKQDLSDPDVIRRFANMAGDERKLVGLYLLTVADVRGTSPKVWNAWKGKLLEDLFNAARHLLQGGTLPSHHDIGEKQSEARRLLRLYGLSDEVQDGLWKQLDVPYFLRHEAQEIAWQTRLLHYRVDSPKPVVKARLSPVGDGLQVMIYTKDQRDLFARICGYFGSINYNIIDAKIHTTRHGHALDTFQVMDAARAPQYREMIALIEHDLAQRIELEEPLGAPAQGRVSRQLKHFPITPEVHIRPDERGQYHLLSITSGDRPGLLYRIARTFSQYGLNLQSAKVVTLGERAEDVFLVSGPVLGNPRAVLLLEQDLLESLQA
jgi:[protein-PII] uridylyltransferase